MRAGVAVDVGLFGGLRLRRRGGRGAVPAVGFGDVVKGSDCDAFAPRLAEAAPRRFASVEAVFFRTGLGPSVPQVEPEVASV